MNRYRYIYGILAVVALLLIGCKDEIEGLHRYDPSDVVMFSTTLENVGNAPMTRSVGDSILMEVTDWVDNASLTLSADSGKTITRSTPTTALNGAAGIYGYVYDESVSAESRVFTNEKFNFDGDNLVPETPYAWKRLENLNKAKAWFCSYAPYEAGSQITPTMYNNSNPGVTYTVPATPAEQIDFLYASSSVITFDRANGTHKAKIPFEYHHALTAIQFRMGFACKVKSVSIKNVKNSGTFTFANGWETPTLTDDANYTITFEGTKEYKENEFIVDGENTLMLLPQSFPEGSEAKVVLVYENNEGTEKTISASLANSSWGMGKKIVYTLYNQKVQANYVYFDLAAGNVTIDASTYSGKIYVAGSIQDVTGSHSPSNKYYVYQSTGATAGTYSGANTGYETDADKADPTKCRIPNYPAITCAGKDWGDYITNNKDVVDVINKWNENIVATGRKSTNYKIAISNTATSTFDLMIDNIYSTLASSRTVGGIEFNTGGYAGNMTLKLKGHNRINNIYYNSTANNKGHLYITSADGNGANTGSLTIASYNTGKVSGDQVNIIGPGSGATYGLEFNGGTVFGGIVPQTNRVWNDRNSVTFPVGIGGGANEYGQITINGGRLTAVSNGTSTAIGGGGGYNNSNGYGHVYIHGGETYAYAFGVYSIQSGREGFVPTTAIGGPSTFNEPQKNDSKVVIDGGYVYAESLGGTAIGGGSSRNYKASSVDLTITGSANVIAKSSSGYICTEQAAGAIPAMYIPASTAIGGGMSKAADGGNATVNISGGKLTTGSIGGGKSENIAAKIGTAQITISGSPVISGQFIMAAGAGTPPKFTMTGGTIQNSNTSDAVFQKVQPNGGAVYMEAGTCNILGGTIKNCSADYGGAIYMNGGTFTMSGGELSQNKSNHHGGAVYISGGNATVTGGSISNNYAQHGNGGGIYLTGGNFSMPSGNGAIIRNTANSEGASGAGSGGGIYIASATNNVTADIISGSITNNTADHDGGGMCVDMSGSAKATITIGTVGGTPASPMIDHNSAALSGGGMCVLGANSDITINSGTIKGNVSAFVQNQDIRNDGGTVTLVGTTTNCDVNYRTVTFHTNYDAADISNNKTAEQRIVTSTNSKLAPPVDPYTGTEEWFYEFHTLQGWNTKSDGTGTTYKKGDIMNISTDIHLYAIWKK